MMFTQCRKFNAILFAPRRTAVVHGRTTACYQVLTDNDLFAKEPHAEAQRRRGKMREADFCFIEAGFCFEEAGFSFIEADFSFEEADFSFIEADFSFIEADFCFTEADFCFIEADFCFIEADFCFLWDVEGKNEGF
jgi:hypothetical protein